MRYYFHVVADKRFIRDPDGGEFTGLNEAEAEAAQSARDMMAAELKLGRPVPSGWRMLIASEDDTILKSLPFSIVASGTRECSERQLTEPPFAVRLFNKSKTVEPPAAAGATAPGVIGLEGRTLMRRTIVDIQETIKHTVAMIEDTRSAIRGANELLRREADI